MFELEWMKFPGNWQWYSNNDVFGRNNRMDFHNNNQIEAEAAKLSTKNKIVIRCNAI